MISFVRERRRVGRPLEVDQALTEKFRDLRGRLEPRGRVLGKQLGDDRLEPGRNLGVVGPDRPRGVFADATEDRHRGLGPERRVSGTHGVHDPAQAEEVDPGVDGLAPGLLRRHVVRRPGGHAALADARVVGRAGETEVGDLDSLDAVLEEDIRRLDIAVHEPLRVCRRQARGHLHANPEHFAGGQRAVALDPCLKRLAGDVLHHEVGEALPRVDRVDRDHMVVGHRRSRPGLAGETQPGRAEERQLGGEDLDRDDAGEGRIRAFQDHAHPPSADDLKDLIRTQGTHVPGVRRRIEEGEDGPPPIPVIGHGPSPPLVPSVAGRPDLGRRKIRLADQEKTQVTP